MIEVYGYRVIKKAFTDREFGVETMNQYEIVYRDLDTNSLYVCILENERGQCSSGYTTATRGDYKIKKVSTKGTLHYVFVNPIELDDIRSMINVNEDGGCGYYPSGYAEIQTLYQKLAVKTTRQKDKRQVYIFKGPSGIGKSYLGSRLGLHIMETDRGLDNTSADVIIRGNKYEYSINDIKSCIADIDAVDVIVVDMYKLEE